VQCVLSKSVRNWLLCRRFAGLGIAMLSADLKQKISNTPTSPGCYLMKNSRGEIIYVGKAVVLRSRVRSYFQKQGRDVSEKVRRMVREIADFDWIATDSELEALILESNLIKQHRPRYNVRLKDDKSYPYICVTMKDRYPRPIFIRKIRMSADDGNLYFGPYSNADAVRETLRLIRKVFRVPCGYKDPEQSKGRACLYRHIGQCLGPCVGAVTETEYARTIREVIMFLEGRQDKLVKDLQKQMEDAAEKLLFEKAARLRDQIQSLKQVMERQKVVSTKLKDQDVIAVAAEDGASVAVVLFIRGGKLVGQEHFMLEGVSMEDMREGVTEFVKQYYQTAAYVPREIILQCEIYEQGVVERWLSGKRGGSVILHSPKRGERRRILDMAVKNAGALLEQVRLSSETDREQVEAEMKELQSALGLPVMPRRIECYDISNIMGTEAVGSLVVFEDGRPLKSDYRRFRIRYTPEKPDDYAMMREVLTRRLTGRLRQSEKFADLPDLIVVDGGRGQLNVALQALAEANEKVSVIGLAKEYEEIYLPDDKPLMLPQNSKALHLLQRVRDEAHRFAVEYHRKLRAKRMTGSVLLEIPGIGKARRSALLKHFGSLKRMREASLEEIASVSGMTRSAAEMVYKFLHPE